MANDDPTGLEPTAADVRRRYPDASCYYGTPDQLCHARLVIEVTGGTWRDVLDELPRALAARLPRIPQ